MTRLIFLVLLFLPFFDRIPLFGSDINEIECISNHVHRSDSLRDRQFLYNGVLWKNTFRRIAGGQYLFTNIFLPGTVSFNGKTFVNTEIRYDICTDEIMIPMSLDQIVQLNKEMVDSFCIVFENKIYRFIKLTADTINELKGYVNVLYKGRSSLYVKYRKNIYTEITNESDGEFYQIQSLYFIKDGIPFRIVRLKDIYKILKNEKVQMRNFVKENKLKVTGKVPESFVPVIRYYDSISK